MKADRYMWAVALVALLAFWWQYEKSKRLIDPKRFPLKTGSKGGEVKALQSYLGIPETGLWDGQTQEAVEQEFKKDRVNLIHFTKYRIYERQG